MYPPKTGFNRCNGPAHAHNPTFIKPADPALQVPAVFIEHRYGDDGCGLAARLGLGLQVTGTVEASMVALLKGSRLC